MRGGPRLGRLFGGHGSADEVDFELTGREWMRIFNYIPNHCLYWITITLGVITSGSDYIFSILQGQLATALVDSDYVTADEFMDAVSHIAGVMFATICGMFALNMLSGWCEAWCFPQLSRGLRMALVGAIMAQDATYFDSTHTGIILSRISEDTSNAQEAYTMRILSFARVVFQWITGLVICIVTSIKVTVIMMIGLPLYAGSQYLGNHLVDRMWLSWNERSTRASAKAQEILTSFRTVKACDAEIREYQSYRDKLFDVHQVVLKSALIHGMKSFAATFIHWGMASFILYYTGMQALAGECAPGAIVTTMSIIHNWSNAFSAIFSEMNEFKKSNVAAAKILQILERQPVVKLDVGKRLIERVTGKIQFIDVGFRYPTRNDWAVHGLSFSIEPGETVAIVGESGCGKSTMLQLIQRFYDASEGQILIDGTDIRELSPIDLRTQIAIVPQSPVMFSLSVKDNVRFGKPKASQDDVVNASVVANANQFIRELRDGYKTQVQQNNLSGGQKQRICIARAVIMDAPILLLDEATAALDTESERLVQEALGNFRRGKTAILVAHRLATIRNADRILVMDKGQIVESGTHDELLEAAGAYAHLVQHQLQ